MKIGIIYVAFGAACDRLAAHCIAYSRKYTNLPICVLTNISVAERDAKWDEIENIEFKHFNLPLSANRQIKTSLPDHTPFEVLAYVAYGNVSDARARVHACDACQCV